MNNALLAQVKEIVNRVPLPEFVHDLEYELDEDHLGNPCVRIRVVVVDGAMPAFSSDMATIARDFAPHVELRHAIADAVVRSGIDLWPYVSISRESEPAPIANSI